MPLSCSPMPIGRFAQRLCSALSRRPFASAPDEAAPRALARLPEGGRSLLLAFTCKICSTRTQRLIRRESYERSTVLARCDGCDSQHIVADNLRWFGGGGKMQ